MFTLGFLSAGRGLHYVQLQANRLLVFGLDTQNDQTSRKIAGFQIWFVSILEHILTGLCG